MSSPRAVRIPRARPPGPGASGNPAGADRPAAEPGPKDHRPNGAGSQRAFRVAALFVVALAALYAAFVLYDRAAPGGSPSAEGSAVLLLSVIFVVFAVGGVLFAVTPAPRSVEVAPDRVVVIGRWGRSVVLPRLDLLKSRVVRRYPASWLASSDVELVELWSEGIPPRNYLVESGLFAGSVPETVRR